ncbi:MAG: type II toxin-antitoxin system VapC family toxin [Paracoccus sp. (in: a-proteobacteria)]|nr:type II toxin-antitoxin system VapC family toxin [Paracoccus sp. (in: a-proteobacteria)]
MRARPERDLFLWAITIGEIERGICQQRDRDPGFAADLQGWLDRTLLVFADRILPFGPEAARIWGRLSQQLGHTGADLMIAATALHHGATVVTGNVADFPPTGVCIENPF